jgi:hypothetical protein
VRSVGAQIGAHSKPRQLAEIEKFSPDLAASTFTRWQMFRAGLLVGILILATFL